ncbi:hypothetical protein AaE_015707 [Aphanomyces astaci]|uniref:Uncharacterized protein n=1 Tax=Aphanomyces astaci TaxID=112090 RepID=A0A6A4Z664_APHAT|nr:hypothetical protein AaE_015707 [Aphanomyces astaci]
MADASSTKPNQRVVWNRPMSAFSLIIALNIVSMPLRAYLTEALPWTGKPQPLEWNGTTYAANSTWMILQRMQSLYNNDTLPAHAIIFKDPTNYTTVMRYTTHALARGTPCDENVHLLPGAIFYGHGMRKAFCKFVQDNSTSASMAHCQHMRQFGVTITEQCVWIHAQPDEASRVVYQTLYQWEVAWFLWAKLILRCVLTGYVVWEMRLHYYDHCVALVRALETYGMPDPLSPLHHIEVYIGDPTCLILGNPLVSLCFVIDFWMSVTSVGEVMLQLSQLDDLGYFLSGCIYSSRTVWFAYFSMRYSTIPIKWWGVHDWVVPLDPTAIAIGAFLLSGPFVYLNATTPLVWLLYTLWSIGVPEPDMDDSTEIIPAVVAMTTIMGFVPVVLVVSIKLSQHLVATLMPPVNCRQHSATETADPSRRYSSMEFNDFNQRMVLSILQPSCINLVRSRGGSVYVLYDLSATFQNMPLFRHRSADCFVVGYDATSTPIEHLRLSLLQCVDLSRNGRSSISVCGMTHDAAVCILNTKPCLATSPIATLRIHPGANSSKWLL